ncbi:hypothetical protein QCA50_005294 [Cerrena zonata]|uniref:F-box domain-containing protein n=1 Tax=Cerrena zonata TaxID=2478898 RepID=A0AAW0GJD1_9APHY
MHRSLQIPEIIRNIFSLSDDDHEGRKALAQCCLTCRFFYEPAADALWYHLPDLAPLLKCLPEEFVFETNHPDEDTEEEDRDGEALPPEYSKYKILYLRRIPEADEHWMRAERHARRVRIMRSFSPVFKETVNISALQALMSRCRFRQIPDPPSSPFLPNLRELSWPFFQNEGIAFTSIPLLAGPHLRKFRSYALYRPPEGPYAAQVSQTLLEFPVNFPLLESIEMPSAFMGVWSVVGEVFSTILQDLHHLRRVVLPSVDLTQEALQHLSALPHIEQLDMAGEHMVANFVSPVPSVPFFPSLRIIKFMEIPDLPACTMFIKSLAHRQLESVEIYGDGRSFMVHTMADYARALEPHKTLQKVVLHPNRTHVPDVPPDSPPLDFSFVRPLLSLPVLTTIDVSAPSGVDLNDNDFLQMSMSWPHIERLVIRSIGRSRRTPSATFDSFLHVVHHCPRLKSFQLHLEPTITSEGMTKATTQTSDSAIEWLTINYRSPIPPHETERLCKLILDLFPKLRFLRAVASPRMDADMVPTAESWSSFCTLIKGKIKERTGVAY